MRLNSFPGLPNRVMGLFILVLESLFLVLHLWLCVIQFTPLTSIVDIHCLFRDAAIIPLAIIDRGYTRISIRSKMRHQDNHPTLGSSIT
jgi:hypothetical protein